MLAKAVAGLRMMAVTRRGYIPSSQFTHKNKKNPHVVFPLAKQGQSIGDLKFELYQNILPRTVENFLRLLPRYEGCLVYRIWPSMFLETGDFIKQNGKGGISSSGQRLRDQNYEVLHDDFGIISMVSNLNDVNSRFVITLGPCHFFDYRYVAFGKLTDGIDVLRQAETCGKEGGEPVAKLILGKPQFIEAQPHTALLSDGTGHKHEAVIYTNSRSY